MARTTHKTHHKTNPDSKPNPFNWEPRIRMLDQDGAFVAMISQIVAFRLLRGDAADLLPVNTPSVRLKIPTEQWKVFSEGTGHRVRAKFLKYQTARRTILYGNYHMQSPEGVVMFHCNSQAALWYLNRGLVEFVGESPPTLRFTFPPDGPGHTGDEYYITPKVNCCVVCGGNVGLNRHHVVPSLYRRHMGYDIKSHSYHDVLLSCLACHEAYEVEADKLKKRIAEETGVPLHALYHVDSGTVWKSNHEYGVAVKSAVALVRHGHTIPANRRGLLKKAIDAWLKQDATQEQIQELAQELAQRGWIKSNKELRNYIDHGGLVMRQIGANLEALQAFTERWRQHFLDTMKPRFLPTNWDIHRPIVSKDYEPEGGALRLLHERVQVSSGE